MSNHDLFFDYSSNNPAPDLAKLYRDGYRTLALKATEGVSYGWNLHGKLADQWHKRGKDTSVWHYAFLRPGDGAAQGAYFLDHLKGHLRQGDRVVADVEVPGLTNKTVQSFFDKVRASTGLQEEIYGSPYFLRDHGIRPGHGEGLWLADYANKVAFLPPGWTHYDAWQYTDAARDPSTGAKVDGSRLAPGRPKPSPKPRPKPTTAPLSVINQRAAAHLTKTLSKRTQPLTPAARTQLNHLLAAIDHARTVK